MNRKEFTKQTKLAAHERSKGICECGCGLKIIGLVEYHHIVAASLGGSNDLDNCMVMSKKCHRRLTAEKDIPELAKSQRIFEKRIGVRKRRPFPTRPKSQQWGRQFSE